MRWVRCSPLVLVRALGRAIVAPTGVPPTSCLAEPPWSPPSSLVSMIGPAKYTNRRARSSRRSSDDVTAGELAAVEFWPRPSSSAAVLCFCLADQWVPRVSDSAFQIQFSLNADSHVFCYFCIFSLVAPKNCEINMIVLLRKYSI